MRLISVFTLFLILQFGSSGAFAGGVSAHINKLSAGEFELVWNYNKQNASVRIDESVNGGPYKLFNFGEGSFSLPIKRAPGSYSYQLYGCAFEPPDFMEVCETRNPTEVSIDLFNAPSKPGGLKINGDMNGLTFSWRRNSSAYYILAWQVDGSSWSTLSSNVDDKQASLSVSQPGSYRFRLKACNKAPGSVCSGWSYSSNYTVQSNEPEAFDYSMDKTPDFNIDNENIKITMLEPSIQGDALNYYANIDLPALPTGVKPIFSSHYTQLYVGQRNQVYNKKNAVSVCNKKTKKLTPGHGSDTHDSFRACYLGEELVKVTKDSQQTIKAIEKKFVSKAMIDDARYWTEGAEYRLKSNPAIKIRGFGRMARKKHIASHPILIERTLPSHHTRWVVYYPNGAQAEFSSLKSGSIGWELQSIEDAYSNTIDYHHVHNRKASRYETKALLSNGFKVEYLEEPKKKRHTTTIYAQNDLNSTDKPIRRYIKQWQLGTDRASQYTECGFDERENEVCAKPLVFNYTDVKDPQFPNKGPYKVLRTVADGHGNVTQFDTDIVILSESPSVELKNRVNRVTKYNKNSSHRFSQTRKYTYGTRNDNKHTLKTMRVINDYTNTYQYTHFNGNQYWGGASIIDSIEMGEIIDGDYVKGSYQKFVYEKHPQATFHKYLKQSRHSKYVKDETGRDVTPYSVSKTDYERDKYGTLLGKKTDIGSSFNSSFGVQHKVEAHEYKATKIKHDTKNWLIGFVERDEKSDTRYLPTVKTTKVVNAYKPQAGTTDVRVVEHFKKNGNLSKRETTLRNKYGIMRELHVYAQNSKDQWTTRKSKVLSYEWGYLPKKVENALGHQISYKYHPRFRSVSQITNENSQVSTMTYSPFGEVIKTTNALSAQEEITFFDCESVSGLCPNKAIFGRALRRTHKNTDDMGAPLTIEYFSGEAHVVAADTYDINNRAWRVTHKHNPFGQLLKTSTPHRTTESPKNWTEFKYDHLTGTQRYQKEADGSTQEVTQTASTLNGKAVKKIVTRHKIVVPATEKTSAKTQWQNHTHYYNAANRLIRSVDAQGVPTDFEYEPSGNLSKTRVNSNAATDVVIQYDHFGQKTRMIDPDAGTIAYGYNGFGQVKRQAWAPDKASATKSMSFDYDTLGRLTNREDRLPGSKVSKHKWVYDTRWRGALSTVHSHTGSVKGKDAHTEHYYYNGSGQVRELKTIIAGEYTGSITSKYDHYGREKTSTYPNGLTVERKYSDSGFLAETVEVKSGKHKRIWKAGNGETHRNGDYSSSVLLGNQVMETQTFDAYGQLKNIRSGKLVDPSRVFPSEIQQFDYIFDGGGRLVARETWQGAKAYREFYQYDGLNRLTQAKQETFKGLEFNADKTLDYNYDDLGNLVYRSDKGTVKNKQNLFYQRSNKAGIHGVTKAYGTKGGSSLVKYTYDDYGNVVKRNAENIEYNVFNKPTKIGGVSFHYTANHSRYLRKDSNGKKTLYLAGGAVEIVKQGSKQERNAYIDGLFHYQSTKINGRTQTPKRFYLHRDHIGSVTAITSEQGKAVKRLSYNAWGERRAPHPDERNLNVSGLGTTRGYTGHEMIDENNLIHMNGRVYDPNIGRFLSADILVQAPSFSQSYNRYSYVMNNPLSNTDPSGYACIGSCYSVNGIPMSAEDFGMYFSWYGFDDPGDSTAQVIYAYNSQHMRQINSALEGNLFEVEEIRRKATLGSCGDLDGCTSSEKDLLVGYNLVPIAPNRIGGQGGRGRSSFFTKSPPLTSEQKWQVAAFASEAAYIITASIPIIGLSVRAQGHKPSLSAHKKALSSVHKKVGKHPKGTPGKFGSPQAGNSKVGYRLDPPHDNAARGDAESFYHFNWWDYTSGKRGNGGRSGAIPIID